MNEGIIYIAKTDIDGLIKIGKASLDHYDKRKLNLLKKGYRLQRCVIVYSKKVENYNDKEKLLHKIFHKSRVGDTELFAEDIELVKETLKAFEGEEIKLN